MLGRIGDEGSEENETNISQSESEGAAAPAEQSDTQGIAQSQVEHGVHSNSGMYATLSSCRCLDLTRT
jgi:hypothetical protein